MDLTCLRVNFHLLSCEFLETRLLASTLTVILHCLFRQEFRLCICNLKSTWWFIHLFSQKHSINVKVMFAGDSFLSVCVSNRFEYIYLYIRGMTRTMFFTYHVLKTSVRSISFSLQYYYHQCCRILVLLRSMLQWFMFIQLNHLHKLFWKHIHIGTCERLMNN